MGTEASRWARLWDHLTRQPKTVADRNFRTFVLLNVGAAAACAIHVGLLLVFWLMEIPALAVVNLLSAIVYLVAGWFNRRGYHTTTVVLALAELIVHQALCVYYIGWGAGFQYYLITITTVVFFLPPGRTASKLILVLLAPAAFLGLDVYARTAEPVYSVAPGTLMVFNTVNVAMVFGLLAFLAFNYSHAAEVAEARVDLERRRAESLLHNILPVPIAARLKAKPQVIADGFDSATILFSDIVGFTPLSERMSPARLVRLLNDIFSEFDDLVAESGLEKIKTIGDAYMVAAGVPQRRDDHAQAIADLALDMMEALKKRTDTPEGPLKMRIGICSGPVVAGVIGKRKFIYDLWGDSVNTAARMESHGIPGEIQVATPTYELLKDQYVFEARGTILVKGKGPMKAYLLKGRKPKAGGRPPPTASREGMEDHADLDREAGRPG